MERMSWPSESGSTGTASRTTPSVSSALPECDSNIILDKDLFKENTKSNPDEFIQHCFKRYKLRERYPNAFLKLKPTRFGPAPSRHRILIAPRMQGLSLPRAKPRSPEPLGQKQEAFAVKEQLKEVAKIPTEENEIKELEAWIEERKKFQNLLNKCADVELWLMGKGSSTEQEAKVLRKIRESREVKKAQLIPQSPATSSTEQLLPVRKPKRIIPVISSPFPESLITLQNLLHKQKLKLVDVFNKEDRSKTMKFKRADFIRVIEGTKVPISRNDLEDAVVYLTSINKGSYITNSDLVECQKIWLKEQWKHAKEAKSEELPPTVDPIPPKVDPIPPKGFSSCHSKSKVVLSQKSKSNHLEVPPINTELDRMPLSYIEMEEVGKRYREMRRQRKRKITPIEWAENCRVVKSGDPVVDRHCLPSTTEGDMGELVDRYRMACHLVWFQCIKLCEQYRVPFTEKLLQRALLYPGDKLLNYKGARQNIRQPGGYYEYGDQQGSVSESGSVSGSVLQEQPKSPDKEKKREEEPKPKKLEQKGKPIWGRWKSYSEFRSLMRRHSRRLRLAAQNLWDDMSIGNLTGESQMQLEKKFIEKEMRKMFAFLNPKTDANSFWPGHLLDKLRLYLPQMERDEGEALFSHVSRTRPAYPGLYHPHRSWPISEKKFVTYGDPDSRKDYYYI